MELWAFTCVLGFLESGFRGMIQRMGRFQVRMGKLVKQYRYLLRQWGNKTVEVSGTRWGEDLGSQGDAVLRVCRN